MVGTRFKYWAGMIWSVSMLSLTTYTGPVKTDCMLNSLATLAANARGMKPPLDLAHAPSIPILPAMLDIKLIRDQPDLVRERLASRGAGDDQKLDAVIALDKQLRENLREADS